MYKFFLAKKFRPKIDFIKDRKKNFFYGIFHHSKNKFYRCSLGKKNPNKIFFVIKRSPGGGFFSNFIFVIKYVNYALKKNYIPIIDMENFPNNYNQKKNLYNIKNIWDLYFDNISKYKLKDVYNSKNVIFSKSKLNVYLNDYNNKELKKTFSANIKINQKILNKSIFFFNKNFKKTKNNPIGIHLRGTDQIITPSHHLPPTIYDIIIFIEKKIKEKPNTKFFLVTEQKKYFNILKRKYGALICAYPSFRANKISDFNNSLRNNHRNRLGLESLIEGLILSYCNEIVFCNSNIPFFSFFVSTKNIKKILISHGINSSNPVFAYFKWYITVLPISYLKYIIYKLFK